LTLSETAIVEGESVDVGAKVVNNDDTSARGYTANLTENGSVVDTMSGTVSAGSNTTVVFTRSYSGSGDYNLSIEGLPPKTLTVQAPASLAVNISNTNDPVLRARRWR